MTRARLALALALSALPLPAAALGSRDTGTSGAQFLKFAPGARPAGMGEAFSGLADDIHAVYFNPAGLAWLPEAQATGMHHAHLDGVRYGFAALAVPLRRWQAAAPPWAPVRAGGRPAERPPRELGVLAVGVYNLAVAGIERRGTVETDAPVGTFGASDAAYSLAYGLG
ncbi:MAG: hypothetical protein HY554_02275, partial [Elusimicrobia bacterium]|nr:hypothetical protein [Elusimicrobiota bacterium]